MPPVLAWGIPIIEWFQALGESLLPIMEFFSFLGTEYFYLFIMPGLFWCFDHALGFRVGLILLVSSNLNAVLKMALGWPRPYWVSDQVTAHGSDKYFGAPSGHAQNAVTLWGRIAIGIRNRWMFLLAILLVIGISVSRLYLGVHFPTDVLAGWIVGGILLTVFLKFEAPIRDALRKQTVARQLLIVLLFSLSLLFVGLLVSNAAEIRGVPTEWSQRAGSAFPDADPISPTDIDDIISTSGVLLGFGSGGVLLFSWGGFISGGSILKRSFRFLIGIAGVVAIFFGLRELFPTEPQPLGQILRFIRYGLVGFWVSYPAPRLFVILKLV